MHIGPTLKGLLDFNVPVVLFTLPYSGHEWHIFYGDPTQDVQRFCRFKDIRLLREGVDDLQKVPGLEWETYIHA